MIHAWQTLLCDTNNMIALGRWVGRLRSLHTLSVRENYLTFLPAELGAVTSLRHLDVSANRLKVAAAILAFGWSGVGCGVL